MWRRCTAGVAALLVAALVGAPASAVGETTTGQITGIQVEGDSIQVAFSAAPLASGQQIDLDSVVLSVNGEPLETTAQPFSDADIARVAILTLDASGSMEGPPIEAAKQAALNFIDGVPDEVEVGLVTFNSEATVEIAATTDRDAVAAAINGIELAEQTRMYDGIVTAVDAAGDEGFRSLVLLSDGRDTGEGTSTLDDAVSSISSNGVSVDAVALGEADEQALAEIVAAGNGRVLSAAEAADLPAIFAAQAEAVASEVLAQAVLPPGSEGQSVTVSVAATVGETDVSADALFALPAVEVVPETDDSQAGSLFDFTALWAAQPWVLAAALGAIFIGLGVVLFTALSPAGTSRGDAINRRMSVYTLTPRKAKEVERTTTTKSSAVADQALGLADQVVRRGGIEQNLDTSLSAAAIPLRPAEWILIHSGSAFGTALLLLLLSSFNPWWALLGLGLGTLIPFLVLSFKRSRRERAFTDQLPDTLTLMAGSLAAGYSMPQAVDTVVREGIDPMASEMRKALIETRLGVPIDEALENIAIRTGSEDFAWVVMAIRIQREVGGNLSEILRIVAETIRERQYLRRQVRTLSAEGRISAIIISSLPPLFALYLLIARPDYLVLLFTETLGIAMVIGGLILWVIGVFWMRRIVDIEV
jgi:tight adherence protein B